MSNLLHIFVAVVILALVGVFLLWPRWQKIAEVQQGLAGKMAELGDLERRNAKMVGYHDKLEKHGEDLAKIEFAIPPRDDFPAFFYLLQNICSQNGIVMTGISPSLLSPKNASEAAAGEEEQEDQEKLRVLSTGLSVSGSYEAFLNLLSALERSARLIEVPSVSFSSPEEGDAFSFSLSLKAHSY